MRIVFYIPADARIDPVWLYLSAKIYSSCPWRRRFELSDIFYYANSYKMKRFIYFFVQNLLIWLKKNYNDFN